MIYLDGDNRISLQNLYHILKDHLDTWQIKGCGQKSATFLDSRELAVRRRKLWATLFRIAPRPMIGVGATNQPPPGTGT